MPTIAQPEQAQTSQASTDEKSDNMLHEELRTFEAMLAADDRNAVLENQTIPFMIHQELARIEAMLLDKNRKYGNSVLEPLRIFSKANPLAQIDVRIDDKLSRIKNLHPEEREDPELDLIGYLILRRVARIIHSQPPED